MGTIKDLVDLTAQLANSVQDRKVASEISAIQTLILNLQSEQADLHESNIELREEKLTLKERIQQLEEEVFRLKSSKPAGPSGVPICPNCSTDSKPVYMSPYPKQIAYAMKATHSCTVCGYAGNAEKS